MVFLSHALVERIAAPYIIPEPDLSSQRFTTALVLGTSRLSRSGRPNPFFEARMDHAAMLVRRGVVAGLVVSGDNAHVSYNEPAHMTAALVQRGVDAARIVPDFAGFRTLDSVVRMTEVFGQRRFLVVSQRFHVERALFVAHAHGIDAWGSAARDVGGSADLSVRLREYLARVRAVLDVYVLNTAPRFLGEPVPIEFPPALGVDSRSL